MWATAENVGTLLQRSLSWEELQAAEAWLVQAEALVSVKFPTAATAAGTDTTYASILRWTVAGAVARVMRNPTGVVSESVDDYTYRLGESASSGALTFTDDEWTNITPPPAAAGDQLRGAWTVNTLPRRRPDVMAPWL